MTADRPAADAPALPDRAAPAAAPAPPEPDSLKAFIAGNMPLLTTFTVLAGLAGFVLTLPLGWFGALLRSGQLVLTVVVWLDLLDQLPQPLLLSHWRHYPGDYGWRLVWFAYLIQLLMLGFIVYLFAAYPRVAVPALAAVVAVGVTTKWGQRASGLARLAVGVLVFELVLMLLYPTHQGILGWLLDRLR